MPGQDIYGAIALPTFKTPEQYAAADLLRQKQQQAAAEARAQAVQRAALSASMQPDGSVDEAKLSVLMRAYPDAYLDLKKKLDEQKKAMGDARKVDLDNENTIATSVAQTLQGIEDAETDDERDQRYRAARVIVGRLDPATAKDLGERRDPVQLQTLINRATSRADYNKAHKEAIDLAIGGQPEQYLGRLLPIAPDAAAWEDALHGAARLMGRSYDSLKRQYGEFSPENGKRAAQIAIGAEKGAELAGQAETRVQSAKNAAIDDARQQATLAETMRHNRASEGLQATQEKRLAAQGAEGAGGAKLSATAIDKIAGVEQSLGMMDDIERLLPKMADYVGPVDGRVAKARITTGAGVTDDLAQFDAQITGLKNAVVKAITGAQMSEPEAKRIMGQIPDLTNPETVFKARLATTRRNLELLKKRTIELSGGTVAPKSPASTSGKTIGRFQVEVTP